MRAFSRVCLDTGMRGADGLLVCYRVRLSVDVSISSFIVHHSMFASFSSTPLPSSVVVVSSFSVLLVPHFPFPFWTSRTTYTHYPSLSRYATLALSGLPASVAIFKLYPLHSTSTHVQSIVQKYHYVHLRTLYIASEHKSAVSLLRPFSLAIDHI
jgi:hypothetical protein